MDLWLPLLAFVVVLALTRSLFGAHSWLHIQDLPNERSLHVTPVPRTGGVAVVLGLSGVLLWVLLMGWRSADLVWIAAGGYLVAAISLFDDYHHVPARWRFLVHVCASLLLMLGGYQIQAFSLPLLSWPLHDVVGGVLTLIVVVWMINLYNFMDGMDGFSGGMSVVGFLTMALIAWQHGYVDFSLISASIAAAAAGFLVFNYPPARIFMGDIGASTLGFLAIALALWAARDGIFPLWVAILIFSPFIVDATVTLLIRMARGDRVWEAHKMHAFQRLVEYGWGHQRTVLYSYVLMLCCAGTAYWAVNMKPAAQGLVLLAWGVIYILLWQRVKRLCGDAK